MADLTLSEYSDFSEGKIKEILIEERIHLYGRDFTENKTPAQKSVYSKYFLKTLRESDLRTDL